MQLDCLRDKEVQTHFKLHWEKASSNERYYFTKDNPTIHHKTQRSRYTKNTLNLLYHNITLIHKNICSIYILTS